MLPRYLGSKAPWYVDLPVYGWPRRRLKLAIDRNVSMQTLGPGSKLLHPLVKVVLRLIDVEEGGPPALFRNCCPLLGCLRNERQKEAAQDSHPSCLSRSLAVLMRIKLPRFIAANRSTRFRGWANIRANTLLAITPHSRVRIWRLVSSYVLAKELGFKEDLARWIKL